MIQLQKIELFKFIPALFFIILLANIFYFYCAYLYLSPSIFWEYLIFFLLSIVIIIIAFFFKKRKLDRIFSSRIEELQERINIFREDISKKQKILQDLPSRIEKILSLSKLIDEFVKLTEVKEIYSFMVEHLKEFFPNYDEILIFLLDDRFQRLKLTFSDKKQKIAIREKEGDVFDHWIVKNNQSILVEDIVDDFRFDSQESASFKERGIRSLIGSPISLGTKILGLVRIGSKSPKVFSIDDLRLLRIFCDITAAVIERAKLFENVRQLAIRDSLTGVFLRDIFMERLKEEITRSRITQKELALGILDIDDFKRINDTYGHTVGDLVLRRVARILSKIIGDSGNLVARFGGEEFVFFIVRANKELSKRIASTIVKRIEEESINFRRKQIRFTVSMGVVIFPYDGNDVLSLLDKADSLLYKAKKEGKNRVCFTF